MKNITSYPYSDKFTVFHQKHITSFDISHQDTKGGKQKINHVHRW